MQIVEAAMSNDMESATLYFLLLIEILLYLFLSMYVPQKITDHNNELFNAMYVWQQWFCKLLDTVWYAIIELIYFIAETVLIIK